MALQWMILACVVAVEAAVAALVTLPVPRAVRGQIVALTSLFLQPLSSVIPFAAFQILDLYWKKEHRLMCTSEICTAEERIRFEKSVTFPDLSSMFLDFVLFMFKAQRNVILCVSACLLYWCIYRIVKLNKDIKALEETEKRLKEE
ncbi:B-cell receptor-associated 31-like [Zea mays]|uniref:Endoplasmic reticulum transmembrane protein n=1 Tax=Zea mays TaxID=4577 RepID=A0A1D6JVL3_MAIZE|nr:B-cell receptor-associated 31-like [Zea mays]